MKKIVAGLALVVATVGLALGVGALFAWLMMKLWNYAVVPTFHAPRLSFWVTWGLIVLFGLVMRMIRGERKSR